MLLSVSIQMNISKETPEVFLPGLFTFIHISNMQAMCKKHISSNIFLQHLKHLAY
jgi:hypothetical protein